MPDKYKAAVADNWPVAVIGLGGLLTIGWTIGVGWLVLKLLLKLF